MEDDTAIEMFVGGLVLDPNTQAPVVVLKDEGGEVHLPIWIGVAEATSIASAIKELHMARPLTHDLIQSVFLELGVRVQRVVITDLKDSTYYAELILSYGDKALILDSRPSDAIAIALRAAAPIFVTRSVLDQAQITFSQSGGVSEEGGDPESRAEKGASEGSGAAEGSGEGGASSGQASGDDGEESPEEEGQRDFKNIDKEKWQELLAELDPDDFKYKT